MRNLTGYIGFFLLLSLIAQPLIADDSTKANPWETFSMDAGLFWAYSSTDVRFGTGLGVEVNVEDTLGLETENGGKNDNP